MEAKTDPKKRIFLSIDFNKDLKEDILQIQNSLPKSNFIRKTPPSNFHLTLYFFGDKKESEIEEISKEINQIIKNFESFSVEVRGLGAFPNLDFPKIIFLRIYSSKLKELNRQLRDKFSTNLDEKSFIPHITLAKVKKDFSQISKNLDKNLSLNKTFTINNNIYLKESIFSEGRVFHYKLKQFSLKKPSK